MSQTNIDTNPLSAATTPTPTTTKAAAPATNESPIYKQIEEAAVSQSRYMKIQPGQTVVVKFDPDKIQLVDRVIENKKSKAVQYTVVNVNDGQEKILSLSLSWALNVNELLKAGYRNIKVSRRGSGLDTSYNFIPV